VDDEAAVVGQGGEAGCGGRCLGLEAGVLDERGAGLLRPRLAAEMISTP
jgi:hypothetical protein